MKPNFVMMKEIKSMDEIYQKQNISVELKKIYL